MNYENFHISHGSINGSLLLLLTLFVLNTHKTCIRLWCDYCVQGFRTGLAGGYKTCNLYLQGCRIGSKCCNAVTIQSAISSVWVTAKWGISQQSNPFMAKYSDCWLDRFYKQFILEVLVGTCQRPCQPNCIWHSTVATSKPLNSLELFNMTAIHWKLPRHYSCKLH